MSDKSKITTQSTKNSSRIEELSSDYTSSSEESLKEHNLNNSGLNTSNDDFFHFNSNNNKNNNEKKDKGMTRVTNIININKFIIYVYINSNFKQ